MLRLPVLALLACSTLASVASADHESRSFPLRALPSEVYGGIFSHDLDGDGALDLVVTGPGFIDAYAQDGALLWTHEANIKLWEFSHHPSAIAGDLGGDGAQEIAYLSDGGEIAVLDARTGEAKWSFEAPGEPWALVVLNVRGQGDRELLLQYSQERILVVDAVTGDPIWETEAYRGIEHSPARVADLDGDGLDEVAGAVIIDDDGSVMSPWDPGGRYRSMDSMVIADVVPGFPLEVVMAEQIGADSHTVVLNSEGIVFSALNPWDWEDPDKVVAGDFDPDRPGLEIFNRSSGGDGTARRGNEEPYRNELAPWVLSSSGELISRYHLLDMAPEGWTGHGIEEIAAIDWFGDGRDYIAGKERHTLGRSAVIDPITGEFLEVFDTASLRLYVIDLQDDAREEVVSIEEDGSLRIFWNPAPSGDPGARSPWDQQHYRRQKQNWNYYSP